MSPPPQVPYIGSTISLLSKANIRYEGFLYTIDQKESSVALSHVKVFGTEDRQCDRPVPPSDEIFEFIIFRASDITELKVIDTPPARSVPDPAIIRAQNKPPADQETNPSVKDFLMQAGPSAAAAASGGASAAPVGRAREVKREPVSQLPPNAGPNNQGRFPRNQANSGSSAPAGANAGRMQPNRNSGQPKQQQPHQYNSYYGNSYQHQQRRGGYRGGHAMPPPPAPPGSGNNGNYYSGQQQHPPPPPYGRYGAPYYPGQGQGPMPPYFGGQGRGGGGGGGRPIMHFRRYHYGGGGGGGGGRWGRGQQQQQQHHQQQQHQQHNQHQQRSVDPIPARFTADYDFETANAEMEAELAKLCLGQQQQQMDAEGDNGQQQQHEQHEQQEQQQEGDELNSSSKQQQQHSGYDKEKSFYDDISRVDFDERPGAGDAGGNGGSSGPAVKGKREAQKQNALNKETFGMIGGRMRRGIGNRFYGNRHYQQHRRAPV